MSQSRKHRGYRSQKVAAEWFQQHGWPFAESTGAGRAGVDVTGMPGLAVEVKARREFSPVAWLRQAAGERRLGLPLVVFRPDGFGEASVHKWGVLLSLADATELLLAAGYGSAQDQPDHAPDDDDRDADQ